MKGKRALPLALERTSSKSALAQPCVGAGFRLITWSLSLRSSCIPDVLLFKIKSQRYIMDHSPSAGWRLCSHYESRDRRLQLLLTGSIIRLNPKISYSSRHLLYVAHLRISIASKDIVEKISNTTQYIGLLTSMPSLRLWSHRFGTVACYSHVSTSQIAQSASISRTR